MAVQRDPGIARKVDIQTGENYGREVVVVEGLSALQVDTELPAAAALSDAIANPTTPMVGAALMGFDGSVWRRYYCGSSGQLRVTLLGAGGTAISDQSEGDSASNHTGALGVLSHPYRYNSDANTWERWLGNHNTTALASASRSATVNSADQTNLHCRGVLACLHITVAPGVDTVQLALQAKDPLSGQYVDIVTSTAIAATGAYFVYLAPGAAALGSFNNYFNGQLPHTWRARVVHSGANPFTYSVGALLLQ